MRQTLVALLVVFFIVCGTGVQIGLAEEPEEDGCVVTDGHEFLTDAVLDWSEHSSVVSRLPKADILTLVFMESTGNSNARRPGSRFYGLLQISDEYMQDALEHADQNIRPASTLMGNGRHSFQIFQWYMERYSHLHNWRPEYVAMVHKAGPTGFSHILNKARQEDLTFEEAVCAGQTPRACAYYKRFHEVRVVYRSCFRS